MFQKISKGIQVRLKIISSTSKEIPGYLKKFNRYVREVSRVFQVSFQEVARMIQECFKKVSMVFQDSFKEN